MSSSGPPGAQLAEPISKKAKKRLEQAERQQQAPAAPTAKTPAGKKSAAAAPQPSCKPAAAPSNIPKGVSSLWVPPPQFAEQDEQGGVTFLKPCSRFLKQCLGTAAASGASVPPSAPLIRGIMNPSNHCFIASVSQVIVHCAPLAHCCVTAHLKAQLLASAASTPAEKKSAAEHQQRAAPLLGKWILNYWSSKAPTPLMAPQVLKAKDFDGSQQQDCHEFLNLLLKAIDSDMKELRIDIQPEGTKSKPEPQTGAQNIKDGATGGGGGGKGWITVGHGGKKLSVTRHQDPNDDDYESEVTEEKPKTVTHYVLGGEMQSMTKGTQGGKKGITSVLVEPFTSLAVNVTSATTNMDEMILKALAPEIIERPDDESLHIRKQSLIGSAPRSVLLILLNRWATTREGDVVKLDNAVDIPAEYSLPFKALASKSVKSPRYTLTSVICHRGHTPQSGHYVSYVLASLRSVILPTSQRPTPSGVHPQGQRQQAPGAQTAKFVLLNDQLMSPASLADIGKDTPYLLVYQAL